MKILIDAQLPPGLKLMLAEAGHEALHVIEVGLRDADDAQIWDYAVREGATVLTKDEDFAARRLREPHAQLSSGSESATARAPLWCGGSRPYWHR